jgi:hypothetical protein
MSTTTAQAFLEQFGVVTVMDVHVYRLKTDRTYGTHKIDKDDFESLSIMLDTLKISSIKQSAPKKTFSVGLFNIPQIRTGKTVEVEIQDALGRKQTLNYFFGLNTHSNTNTFAIGTRFSDPICLEGYTFIVDEQGNKQQIWITIPCFVPKGTFNVNLQSDGEAGVFDLSGEAYPVLWDYQTDSSNWTYENEPQYIRIGLEPLLTGADTYNPINNNYDGTIEIE